MEWVERLWQELTPHLPAGQVGLWVPPTCRPINFTCPATTLPSWHDPAAPAPPGGSALQGLLMFGCGPTPLPWPAMLAALPPFLAPQAPLLLLVPRQGLVALREPGWTNPYSTRQWRRVLHAAGWQVAREVFLGGSSWPGPWATAALRLYVCQRRGLVPPARLQFSSKRGGTAPATGCG
ncbi:MAG: hypothetical protein INF43_04555 [Alphaproteobacteria bacterium]|nr:hypothetical protein [Alphaproteobacteria bacterium]